jgi:serine protease
MGRNWLSWRSKGKVLGSRPRSFSGVLNGAHPLGEQLEDRRLLAALTELNTDALSQLDLDTTSHRAASLLVQFREGTVSSNLAPGSIAGSRLTASWAIAPGLNKVELDAGADLDAALAAYRNDPNVLFAEPDYRVSLNLLPDDSDFGNLWGLNNDGNNGGTVDADIDAPEAWDVTTGSHDTIVAVIDTGIDYTHPDLADNIWTNAGEIPGNRIDDDRNGYVDDVHGYDFVNRDGDPMDDHFHGTHVAGTIGAVGNDANGITGVNWHVQIMALKFLDASGGGYTSDAIEALNYAVANGAIASNNSWGGGGFSSAFQTAIQNAANQGHIFVAAAGNEGINNDLDPFYPAGYNVDNVISVAATDSDDDLAYFSNYGTTSVDLAAPGVNIYSTFPTRMTDAMRDEGFPTHYASISGTSMATPHVTGVVALVASLHPDWGYDQIIQQVLGTVDVIPAAAKTVTGGRLNAAAAVGNAPPDTTGPRVVSIDPANGINGPLDHVRLRFNETIDPATISLDDVVSLTGPDGPLAALAVVPVAGSTRQFDVTFATQTTVGSYALVIGPNISDASGNVMDQDADGIGGEDPDDIYTAAFSIVDIIDLPSSDVPAEIHNLMVTGSFLTVNQDVTISDLNLKLDIWYPYDGDLWIYLVSPRGTRVDLSAFNGGMDADFTGTTFDDEADTPISYGYGPYTGSFQPDQPLSAFDGENARGEWTLVVEAWPFFGFLDGDGYINAWSLQLEGDGGGGTPPPPPPGPNRAPVAGDDSFVGNDVNVPVAITTADLLANDTDPDGNKLAVTFVGNPAGGAVSLGYDNVVTFTPDPNFQGKAGFDYIVSDGALTDVGHVSIDIVAQFQWHNLVNPLDVNGDKSVSSIDAVLIINLLNSTGGGTSLENLLGGGGSTPTKFYDVSPDNWVAPIDAILVINYLNAHPNGSTTAGSSAVAATDGDGVASANDIGASGTTAAANVAASSHRRYAPDPAPGRSLPPAAVDQALRSTDFAVLLGDLQLGRGLRRRTPTPGS